MEVQIIDCLLMTMQFRSGRFLIISVTELGEGIKKSYCLHDLGAYVYCEGEIKCFSVAFLMSTLIFHMRTA